jgi:hypothetical protein
VIISRINTPKINFFLYLEKSKREPIIETILFHPYCSSIWKSTLASFFDFIRITSLSSFNIRSATGDALYHKFQKDYNSIS